MRIVLGQYYKMHNLIGKDMLTRKVHIFVEGKPTHKFIGYVCTPMEFDEKDLNLVLQRWAHKSTYNVIVSRYLYRDEYVESSDVCDLKEMKRRIKETVFYKTVTKEVEEWYDTAEVVEIFKDKPFEIESSKWVVDGEYRTLIKDTKGHSKQYLEEVFKSSLKKSYWGDYYLPGKYEFRDLDIQISFKDSVELQKSYSLVKITRECRIKKEQVVEEV